MRAKQLHETLATALGAEVEAPRGLCSELPVSTSCFADGAYCQSEECQKTKCQSKSVSCLSGTGDFRIALLDTSHTAGNVSADNWCPAVNTRNSHESSHSREFPLMFSRLMTTGASERPTMLP